MRRLRAGFQGELGAFSQEALGKLLGEHAEPVPFERFEDVFRALKARKIGAAVIPIENSLAGSVHENYDHLLEYRFRIAAETNVRIVHNLMGAPGVKFGQLRRVYSHPVALNQCLDFFKANPQLEKIPYYDTAGSAKMVIREKLRDAAAIASRVAAELYGCRILRRSIEDDHRNFTRFFLLNARNNPKYVSGDTARSWKTSVVFTISNTPGALFRSLGVFALRDVSLTKIESRPLRGRPWEYLFYVDLAGREDDGRIQKALGHLAEMADFMRVLGSYPRGG